MEDNKKPLVFTSALAACAGIRAGAGMVGDAACKGALGEWSGLAVGSLAVAAGTEGAPCGEAPILWAEGFSASCSKSLDGASERLGSDGARTGAAMGVFAGVHTGEGEAPSPPF